MGVCVWGGNEGKVPYPRTQGTACLSWRRTQDLRVWDPMLYLLSPHWCVWCWHNITGVQEHTNAIREDKNKFLIVPSPHQRRRTAARNVLTPATRNSVFPTDDSCTALSLDLQHKLSQLKGDATVVRLCVNCCISNCTKKTIKGISVLPLIVSPGIARAVPSFGGFQNVSARYTSRGHTHITAPTSLCTHMAEQIPNGNKSYLILSYLIYTFTNWCRLHLVTHTGIFPWF